MRADPLPVGPLCTAGSREPIATLDHLINASYQIHIRDARYLSIPFKSEHNVHRRAVWISVRTASVRRGYPWERANAPGGQERNQRRSIGSWKEQGHNGYGCEVEGERGASRHTQPWRCVANDGAASGRRNEQGEEPTAVAIAIRAATKYTFG